MIYQPLRLPSPAELSEDPELAVLVALTTNLEMASFALLSLYPDLDNRLDGPDRQACGGEREAYARSIVKQIPALLDIVQEYLGAVERLRSWDYRRPSSAEPSP